MSEPIHLDGTTLEGGGQLLRLATCLASLTSKPIHISNIRGNRSGGGGLKSQHLTSVQWLAQATGARASGLGLKSKEIAFRPGAGSSTQIVEDMRNNITIKQSTPGGVSLVLQAIMPYILFSATEGPINLRITGGTNVSNSPSYDYVEQVLFPMLEKIGVRGLAIRLHSRGWSTGSTSIGAITFTLNPVTLPLPPFHLTHRGRVTTLHATILAPSASELHIREELDHAIFSRSHEIFNTTNPHQSTTQGPSTTFTTSFEDSHHTKRFYLLLVATTSTGLKLGRDWLYDHSLDATASKPRHKSKSASSSSFLSTTEHVPARLVRRVVHDLIQEIRHGGCVDEYMRDHLVVFEALARGRSEVFGGETDGKRVGASLHARTAEWVAEKVVGARFDGVGGCEGIGFIRDQEVGLVEEMASLGV